MIHHEALVIAELIIAADPKGSTLTMQTMQTMQVSKVIQLMKIIKENTINKKIKIEIL